MPEQVEIVSISPLLGKVSEVTKAIRYGSSNLNGFFAIVLPFFQNLRQHLVDVVGISSIDGDLESLLVLLHLEQEWDFLDDLLLVLDQVV